MTRDRRPSEVWLIRHGPARARAHACIGHTDVDLLDPAQTATAIHPLAQAITGARAVISSDLRRARDTARLLSAELRCPLLLEPDLRELDFGAWEGRTWSEIERDDPERYARFMKSWQHERTPGGESYRDLERRTAHAWTRILARGDPAIVVIAHAGSLRALASRLLAISPARAMALPFPLAGGVRIAWVRNAPAWTPIGPAPARKPQPIAECARRCRSDPRQ